MTHKNQSSTIADVAKRAGVSIATVSRVINGNTPVAASTAERVQAAIKELNFVPQSAARVLASRRTNTIGLLLPEIGGWFFPSMLRGIELAARQAVFDLLIHTVDVEYPLKTSRRALGMHNTDGLIVFTNSVSDEELSYLYENNFPIVLLHQTPPDGLNIPVITIENKDGAQKLVDHLIEVHGSHRIAFLRGPEGHEDSEWRERGYRESLLAHGIPFDESLVARGEFDDAKASIVVKQWLENGIEADAIFAGDDLSALGAITALQGARRRVPEDVAVVGFDDIPLARFISPPLTTVRAPTEQTGMDAVTQLVHLIRNESAESITLLPTELVIRKSCGCK
jgi:LacI family transcriptional regulator